MADYDASDFIQSYHNLQIDSETIAKINQMIEEETVKPVEKHSFGFCADCGVNMIVKAQEYYCPECHTFEDIDEEITNSDAVVRVGSVRISTRDTGKRVYGTQDKSVSQKKALWDNLAAKQQSSGIPLDIWQATITAYHQIQQNARQPVYAEDGAIIRYKDYVRRDPLRTKVIGALLKFICENRGIHMNKKQITGIMKVDSSLAKGEQEVRNIVRKGILNLDINDDDTTSSIKNNSSRFLMNLNIKTDNRMRFIAALLAKADEMNLMNSSAITSKIAGAIWLIVQEEGLNIPAPTITAATDNIQKNTAKKFSDAVRGKIGHFRDIFAILRFVAPEKEKALSVFISSEYKK